MSDILVHIDTSTSKVPLAGTFDIEMVVMIWFDNVPSFPPQAVVGVISGVLNIRNVPAFTATSKSTVCLYSMSIYKCILQVCSTMYTSVLYNIIVVK